MNQNHETELALPSPLAEAVRNIAEAQLDERAVERVIERAMSLLEKRGFAAGGRFRSR